MANNTHRWTIHNKPSSPKVGNELNGLQIEQLPEGGYEIRVPGGPVLKSTRLLGFPVVLDGVNFKLKNWNIVASSLPPGFDGSGKWHLPDDGTGVSQDGEYTAQAGSGAGDDPEEAASSAKAY